MTTFTNRGRRLACVAVTGAMLLAACGGSDDSSPSETDAGADVDDTAADDQSDAVDDADDASSPATSGESDAAPAERGERLVYGSNSPPTLNPYLANVDPTSWDHLRLVYGGLIEMRPDYTYEPGFAETFGYVGDDNTVFEMTLREGLMFADGSPMDAQAVVDSLDYFRESGINAASWGATIDTIEAVDELTIRVTNSSPNPQMDHIFSQASLIGGIISPAGLDNPDALSEETHGAGPFLLDTDRTVLNDSYVYVANEKFYDQDRIHFDEIEIRIIPESAARLSALQTDQLDLTKLEIIDVPAAEAAGLQQSGAVAAIYGMLLSDRDGTVEGAIGDVDVRMALSMAIDRESIADGLFGEYATATSQLGIPGFEGFIDGGDDLVTFDPDAARELLDSAGYGDGLQLNVETLSFIPAIALQTEAIIDQWRDIGVEVELTTDPTPQDWIGNILSKEFPVSGFGYGSLPTYLTSLNFMVAQENLFNPYGTADAELDELLESAAAESDPAARAELYQQANERLTAIAWVAPVARIDSVLVATDDIAGFEAPDAGNFPGLVDVRPAG